ncbi:S-layer homology domain-containing protein [Peptoniphilus sp. AGMB00490]|uniref:S-layer homology domain-containing protein n=1 Tax=Peptoniphilus faecalis TaxID=2731255 RepID=A0A848RC63_9FIRM|nr:S-layer homology domain-containing protein [Peptoniphilus faecalis]NMW85408.1 S-layer homology domain-containing protein [Peptoniphilus faecalis]
MNKKIISLVLALVMVLGTFTSVFAAEPTKKEEAKKPEASEKVEKVVGKDNKIQYVIDKKLVEGYEDGSYGLDKNIKRSEITRLLVLANGNEELSKKLQGSMKIYSDVDAKHWANGVITVGTTVPSDANGIAMLAGYPDGSFKPENDVTYAELAKMLVVLAKKDLTADMVKNAVWASSWMTWAAELGILDDVTITDSNKAANRADAFTMVYNALYKMQEFKRVPANETRGIISNLTKDVLQLNQDSKMEYKVTADTVFVTGKDAKRQQIVKLSDINYKLDNYYLGSLVRIITNDKNEVTHIIELGNPAELAINNNPAEVKRDNSVWRGVADNTVETLYLGKTRDIKNDNYQGKIKNNDAYATIQFKNNDVDAKTITFNNVYDKNETKDLVLKINDKTEFYVANPGNNIMKKVANVNEALSLIGFKNYHNYKIVDVYAGFDTDGLDRNWKAIKYDDANRNTAKVVVFNLVNKSFEGEKFRVIESSGSNYSTTLEKTDGTLVDRNNVRDTSSFPLNYGDKLDVIELDDVRAGSNYKTLIDHSSSDYPIVKITKVDSDKKFIEIEDKNGERSILDIRDADIFSAKRYGKLEVGNTIQFKVENKNSNEAKIISLLGDFKLRDSIVGILPTADKTQRVGELVRVEKVNGVWHMVVRVDYNLFDEADRSGYATYIISDTNAEALKDLAGKKIAFKVFERNNNGLFYASDIVLNDNQTPVTAKKVETIKDEIRKLDAKYPNQEAVNKDFENAKKAVENIQKMIDDLKFEDKTEWAKVDPSYSEALNAVKGYVQTKENAIKAEYTEQITKVKEAADKKLAEVKVAKDTLTQETAVAKVTELVKAELKDGVTAKYEVTSFSNETKQAKIKVTFEKAPAEAQTTEVTVTEEA